MRSDLSLRTMIRLLEEALSSSGCTCLMCANGHKLDSIQRETLVEEYVHLRMFPSTV